MSATTGRRALGGQVEAPAPAPARTFGAATRQETPHPERGRGFGGVGAWWSHVRAQPQATWTAGHAVLTRVVQGVFIVSVLCGPVGVAWLALGAGQQQAPAAAGVGYDERAESRRDVAQYLGREWVVAWLSTPRGQEDQLLRYVPQRVELPEQASVVGRAEVVSALPVQAGVWAVTVQVDLEPVPGVEVVRRYYRVPVQVAGQGQGVSAGVLALPAQVPAPVTQTAQSQQYPVAVPAQSALGASVSAFLQAALSGRADEVARLSAPGRQIQAAIDPAMGSYERVQVTSIATTGEVGDSRTGSVPADGATARVKGEVVLVEQGAQQGRPGTWFLTLSTRAGRWEVSAVDQSPAIAQQGGPTQGEN